MAKKAFLLKVSDNGSFDGHQRGNFGSISHVARPQTRALWHREGRKTTRSRTQPRRNLAPLRWARRPAKWPEYPFGLSSKDDESETFREYFFFHPQCLRFTLLEEPTRRKFVPFFSRHTTPPPNSRARGGVEGQKKKHRFHSRRAEMESGDLSKFSPTQVQFRTIVTFISDT